MRETKVGNGQEGSRKAITWNKASLASQQYRKMPLSEPYQPHIPDAMAFTAFAVVTSSQPLISSSFLRSHIYKRKWNFTRPTVDAIITFENRIHGFWLSCYWQRLQTTLSLPSRKLFVPRTTSYSTCISSSVNSSNEVIIIIIIFFFFIIIIAICALNIARKHHICMEIALSEVFDSRAAQASYHKGKLVHGFTIGRVACRDGGISPCTCYRLSYLSAKVVSYFKFTTF